MKILLTTTGPWGTGSFTVAHSIMKELEKQNHQVKIFFPDIRIASDDLDYYYNNPENFEIWQFPIKSDGTCLESFPLIVSDPHPRNPYGKTFAKLTDKEFNFYMKEAEKALLKVIKEFQPDIIECQHIWTYEYILNKLGYKYIASAHHIDQLGYKADKRIAPLAKIGAKNAEYIFSLSDYVKKEVLELYEVDEKKVIVIPSSYDKDIFKPLKINKQELLKTYKLGIPDDATLISFPGKISETKGLDTLLKANKLIEENEKIHFLVFGAGDINRITKFNNKDKFSFNNIHFLGHQHRPILAKFHNICDFTILPSKSEGFAIACLEAMACGLPAIVTNSGGMKEYAVGEIINPSSEKELSQAIIKFAHIPKDELEKLSKKAISVANSFSWKKIIKVRLAYYYNIYNKKNK